MAGENEDTGLGLAEFLAGKTDGEKPDEGSPSSQQDAEGSPPKETQPDPGEGKKPETPGEAAAAGEKPPGKPAGEAGKPGEAKETKPEKAGEKTVELPKPGPEEGKPKEEAKPAKIDWESPENPYVKRLRDTQAFAHRADQKAQAAEQQNQKLEKQLELINKKLDGTYDPEVDGKIEDAGKEKPAGQNEQAGLLAEQLGRASASLTAAVQLYGKEVVDKEMGEYETLFTDNPVIRHRVLSAELPAVEVVQVMREWRFTQKYGRDPDKILEAVRKEVEEELRPKLKEEATKEIMARINKKENLAKGIAEARDAGGPANGKKGGETTKPLNEIFGG